MIGALQWCSTIVIWQLITKTYPFWLLQWPQWAIKLNSRHSSDQPDERFISLDGFYSRSKTRIKVQMSICSIDKNFDETRSNFECWRIFNFLILLQICIFSHKGVELRQDLFLRSCWHLAEVTTTPQSLASVWLVVAQAVERRHSVWAGRVLIPEWT